MPLSRLTQTLPLDFAEAIAGSEAAPVGAALVEVFFAGAEAVVFDADEPAGALEGAIVDLLAGGGDAGAESVVEFAAGAAMPESLEAALLFPVFFGVVPDSAALALGD